MSNGPDDYCGGHRCEACRIRRTCTSSGTWDTATKASERIRTRERRRLDRAGRDSEKYPVSRAFDGDASTTWLTYEPDQSGAIVIDAEELDVVECECVP